MIQLSWLHGHVLVKALVNGTSGTIGLHFSVFKVRSRFLVFFVLFFCCLFFVFVFCIDQQGLHPATVRERLVQLELNLEASSAAGSSLANSDSVVWTVSSSMCHSMVTVTWWQSQKLSPTQVTSWHTHNHQSSPCPPQCSQQLAVWCHCWCAWRSSNGTRTSKK